MLGSTEDKEEAFSFLCESFETEKKKEEKKERGGKKRDQAAALIQPSAIWPASLSPSLSLITSLSLSSFSIPDCPFQLFFSLFCVISTDAR